MERFVDLYEKKMMESMNVLDSFEWSNKEQYAFWLAQSYFFVRHSTRLLSLAAAKAPLDDELTHSRFLSHLKEETGHERLILQDLKAMDYDISQFSEFHETRLFYGHQYYLLDQFGPGPFMGWIIFLEGMASQFGPHAIKKTADYPKNMTRFLRTHAEEDQEHIDSAFDLLRKAKLEDNTDFQSNFEISAKLYLDIVKKIGTIVLKPNSKAA
ncbi:MAG: iron-containing redox enzyme family protein [Bdellovibrionales bacterium]|nr:iron-containing redox enzyme family protein [Bdellovibrionales bacterium]NQZ18156.1 iron-containing redox enzyme family protein [Bdellovibrionales bacterium]